MPQIPVDWFCTLYLEWIHLSVLTVFCLFVWFWWSLRCCLYIVSCHLQIMSFPSFFAISMHFFSCLIAMARTSNTMLSKSSECGHPCPVPSLWKAENFWVCYLWVITCGLYYVEVYSLYTLLWVFILNGYWIKKNAFPASIEIIIWFLSYILLLWCISCLVFVGVE